MHHCYNNSPGAPPERRSLLLLQIALDLARRAVLARHPTLAYPPPMDHDPRASASEVLAELVVERCVELDSWIDRYNDAIDYLPEPDFDPDDIPF